MEKGYRYKTIEKSPESLTSEAREKYPEEVKYFDKIGKEIGVNVLFAEKEKMELRKEDLETIVIPKYFLDQLIHAKKFIPENYLRTGLRNQMLNEMWDSLFNYRRDITSEKIKLLADLKKRGKADEKNNTDVQGKEKGLKKIENAMVKMADTIDRLGMLTAKHFTPEEIEEEASRLNIRNIFYFEEEGLTHNIFKNLKNKAEKNKNISLSDSERTGWYIDVMKDIPKRFPDPDPDSVNNLARRIVDIAEEISKSSLEEWKNKEFSYEIYG